MGVKEAFATRLKKLREIAGYTQSQLAEKLGISRGSISFYENGSRTPDIEILDKVCFFFGVPMDYMLGYIDTTKEENEDIGLRLGLSDKAIDTIENAYFDVENLNKIIEHPNFQNLMHLIDQLLSDKDGFNEIELIIKKSSLSKDEKYKLLTFFDVDFLSYLDHTGRTKYLQYQCDCVFNIILEDIYREQPAEPISQEELEELKKYDERIMKKMKETKERSEAENKKDLEELRVYHEKHADEYRAREAIRKELSGTKEDDNSHGNNSKTGK